MGNARIVIECRPSSTFVGSHRGTAMRGLSPINRSLIDSQTEPTVRTCQDIYARTPVVRCTTGLHRTFPITQCTDTALGHVDNSKVQVRGPASTVRGGRRLPEAIPDDTTTTLHLPPHQQFSDCLVTFEMRQPPTNAMATEWTGRPPPANLDRHRGAANPRVMPPIKTSSNLLHAIAQFDVDG
jgi:hypothetical protein